MNYTKTITIAKESARDFLRMKLISARMSKIADINTSVKNHESCITDINKNIKIAEYQISIIDPKNPEAEDLKKANDDLIDAGKKAIEGTTACMEEIKKLIVEEEEGIKKIEAGETLVCALSLKEKTNELLWDIVKDSTAKAKTIV